MKFKLIVIIIMFVLFSRNLLPRWESSHNFKVEVGVEKSFTQFYKDNLSNIIFNLMPKLHSDVSHRIFNSCYFIVHDKIL